MSDDTDPQRIADTGDLLLDDTDVSQSPDEAPLNFLNMTQAGTWNMTPAGGPYTAMSGQLTVVELLDGDTLNPVCDVIFALVGTRSATNTCTACDDANHVFDITLTTTQGDPANCHDPDLPMSGEMRQFGYSGASQKILHNWNGSGEWLPWYDATRIADQVSFTWDATVGFTLPEDD